MKLRSSVLALATLLMALPALAANNIDGKWNATVDAGGTPVELVFEFKSEGEKLTGNMSAAMMPTATPISEGVIKGDDVSFKLSITMMEGAPALVISYKGKLKGDELALNSVLDMGQGPMETPLVAKRAK